MKKLTAILVLVLAAAAGFGGDAVKKVMFVGDSIALGVGAKPRENRFSTVAVKMLNEHAGKTAYVEHNIAISGSNLCESMWPGKRTSGYPYRLQDVLKAKPDILVLQHGVNDVTTGSSLGDYGWSYRHFVRSVKEQLPGTVIVCMTLSPGIRSGASLQWQEQANAIIQEVAAKESTLLAPVSLVMNDRNNCYPDRLHPNNDGHRIIAEALVKTIEENQPQSPEKFDFVIRQAGIYKICNYVFTVSDEAAENGITCFLDITPDSFKYAGNGKVDVRTPIRSFFHEVTFQSDNRDCVQKFSWHKYLGCSFMTLSSTGGTPVQIKFVPVKGPDVKK